MAARRIQLEVDGVTALAELLISYGQAEYRWPTGRRYVTPVAELEGDGSALFEALRRTHTEGEKRVVVRQKAD